MRYIDFKIFRFDFVSLYCLIYKIAQDMKVGNTAHRASSYFLLSFDCLFVTCVWVRQKTVGIVNVVLFSIWFYQLNIAAY